MFGRKKDNSIRVQHYEGLKDFIQDFPCTIQVKDDQFIIKRIKPETTVDLPLERILQFDVLEEKQFMVKYHNEATTTDKGVKKYYLVVRYQTTDGLEKHLAFWGTASEYSKFIDLRTMKMNTVEEFYSL